MTSIPHDWLKKLADSQTPCCMQQNMETKEAFEALLETTPPPSFALLREEISQTMQEALHEAKEEEAEEATPVSGAALPPLFIPGMQIAPVSSSSTIPAVIVEVFSEMLGAMTHLHTQGKTETTFFLDNVRFANSPFCGSKIVIEEYSSAPKSFNVYLIGEPQAAALFQQHAPELLSTFSKGKFGFKIHRLETHLFPKERYSVKRKEESKDQTL